MKSLFVMFILIFIISCTNENKTKPPKQQESNNTKSTTIKQIKQTKKETKKVNFKPNTILVFIDKDKTQIQELKKLNLNFIIIKDDNIKKEFNITKYPTIIFIEKNSTKRYTGFIPAEMLKYEIKD